jgi:glycosyltransferase involved in cell wall biosynthesis
MPADPGQSIRLCYVVAADNGLGAVVTTLRELRVRFGYDISAVVSDIHSPMADNLREAGVTVFEADFRFNAFPGWWGLTSRSIRLARLFRRERFDVVLTCLWHSMLVGRLAGWLADVPVRLTRVAGPYHLEAPVPRWIDARTSWAEHVIIGVCQQILSSYRELGVPEHKLRVMYSARDLTDFDPAQVRPAGLREEFGLPAGAPLVGMVSWFYSPVPPSCWTPLHLWGRAIKGHETLIEAAAIVAREEPAVRFVIVGSGWDGDGARYMARIQALAEASGVADRVIFLGARSDVPAVYRDLDVAAHPSRTEGAGAAIESLLMACPTVATRIGGMIDVVVDGETGVLVDVDDPADLARGILKLLRDRPRAEALARAGRERVMRLADVVASTRELDALCRQVLARTGSRAYGDRPLPRRRIAALGALCLFLQYGMRLVEVRSRLDVARGRAAPPGFTYLDVGPLILVGADRQPRAASLIRRGLAVARGDMTPLRRRGYRRLVWVVETVTRWRRRGH